MTEPREFFTSYKQAAWDKNVEQMIDLYDDEIVIFDMWEKGYQVGLLEWAREIKSWLGSLGMERVKVNVDHIEIHQSEEFALGHALITYQAVAPDHTVLRSMRNRITVGFQKKNGQWKVIHQHTSAPIDSELKAILQF